MYCEKCGQEVNENMAYCPKCSEMLIFNLYGKDTSGVTYDELQIFVGHEEANKYMKKWLEYSRDERDSSPTWNWAAFFLGIFWIAYRKMYLYALILASINLTLVIIIPDRLKSVFNWIMIIFIGMYGNKFYYSHAKKKITKIKEIQGDGSNINQRISESGGTNILAAFGVMFFYIICGVVAYFIS